MSAITMSYTFYESFLNIRYSSKYWEEHVLKYLLNATLNSFKFLADPACHLIPTITVYWEWGQHTCNSLTGIVLEWS